jgi:hypothetical protein
MEKVVLPKLLVQQQVYFFGYFLSFVLLTEFGPVFRAHYKSERDQGGWQLAMIGYLDRLFPLISVSLGHNWLLNLLKSQPNRYLGP